MPSSEFFVQLVKTSIDEAYANNGFLDGKIYKVFLNRQVMVRAIDFTI